MPKNSETSTSLNFALASEYISVKQHLNLSNQGIEIGKLIRVLTLQKNSK